MNNKRIALAMMVVLMTGCAMTKQTLSSHDKDYLQQTQTVSPARLPADLNANTIQPYYPIPAVTATQSAPTIAPPGSLATATAAPAANKPMSVRSSSVIASSSNALVLNMNYNQAWGAVGQALHASGYKVMQQDKSIGGYYIVDVASTGGKLRTTTPIYQVHVQASGNNTTVSLLNDKASPADPGVSGRILSALKSRL